MSCERAAEIDFAGFLVDPGADEFASFRSHYPTCVDCSRTVGGWLALDLGVRAAADAPAEEAHPGPEELDAHLARLEAGDASDAGGRVARHLEGCPGCRAELEVLRRFSPETVRSEVAARSARRRRGGSRLGRLASERPGAVWGTVAVAAAAALAVLVLGPTPDPGPPSERGAPQLAAGAGSEPAGEPSGGTQVPAPDELAAQPAPPPTAPAPPSPPSPTSPEPAARDEAPAGGQLAAADRPEPEPVASPEPPSAAPRRESEAGDPRGAPGARGGQEDAGGGAGPEILLAALTDLPPPEYAFPDAWVARLDSPFDGLRSAGTGAVRLAAPADHVGLTREASPRLWWSLDAPSDHPIRVTLTSEDGLDPLLDVELPPPHPAGLRAIDLSEHSVRLERGEDLRWFVSIVVDPAQPSRNLVAGGGIRRVGLDGEAEAALAAVPLAERGHALARQGLWYDAFDFFAELERRHPEAETADRFALGLLEQVRPSADGG